MTAFTHLEPGTSESVWGADGRILSAPPLWAETDAPPTDLVVVAAHPDDETLGAGGLIARVHGDGGSVTVIVATDGEASHPFSDTHSPDRLAGLRRVEVARAVHLLAPGARVHFLGLPDGALRDHTDRLARQLTALIDPEHRAQATMLAQTTMPAQAKMPAQTTIVVAPWSGDGHGDHRIVAEATEAACAIHGLRHLGYPIWLWHWGGPDDVPWQRLRSLDLTDAERAAKRSAMATHLSQVHPLSSAAGDEAVVHDRMQEHFDRPVELFFDEKHEAPASLQAPFFEGFYARHDDPWGFETRWYEQRKRRILISALPDERLGNVLEIGCSTGLVTELLAARADRVVAVDPARAAIEKARTRAGVDERVSFIEGSIPQAWPAGRYDTIVLSEVGYYLSPGDLAATIDRIDEGMTDQGCLLACHWRNPVTEYPLTGDDVHRALRAHRGWDVLVRHEERDFVLEVFVRAPARSVAEREGLR